MGEIFAESFVSKYRSFFHSINAFAGFQVDIAFRIKKIVGNFVFVEDLLGDVAAMQEHLLLDMHS